MCLHTPCVEVMSDHQPDSPRRPWRLHTPAPFTAQLRLHILRPKRSNRTPGRPPILLKSGPSTSPTHPGGHGDFTDLPR